MTTSTTTSKDDRSKDDQPQGTITGKAKLDNDARFKIGPPLIQTSEDATMAYLREEITEDEYRTALGKFGTLPGQLFKTAPKTERVDAAFERTIPDDVYEDAPMPEDDLKVRLDGVKKEEEEREKAVKEAEDDKPLKVQEVPPGTPTPKSEDKK